MNTRHETTNQTESAAAWILKSLHTNTGWFDEMRLAGRKNFERKYHYIPLIDISLQTHQFNITTLKDACYMLKENSDVDIWGDDFEPYGMLVQISDKGVESLQHSHYAKAAKISFRKGLTVLTAIVVLTGFIIGIKKSITSFANNKNAAPTYNKSKAIEITPKATAFLNSIK
jgi:hypothetical protein